MRASPDDPDAQKLAEEISKRQRRLEAIRKPFDLLYDDVDDYVVGRRADIASNSEYRTGTKQGSKIYDQTAGMALQDFVDGYQGNSAAPTIKWWSPGFRDKKVMQVIEVRKWLDDVYEAINQEINNSNFYSAIADATWDRALDGHSTIFGPEWSARRNRLIYYLRHPREVYFSLNAEGDPDLWHRKFQITGRQILDLWPYVPLKEQLSQKMKKDPYNEYTCIHAIFPREEYDITKINAENKPYASVYMLDLEKIILEESGMDPDEVPTTARWRLTAEPYPRSIAIDTIYSTMMVNQMSRSVLRAAQLMVEPPYLVTGTMKGKLKITPGGLSYLDNPNDKAEPLQFPSQLQAGLAEIADTRQALSEMFKAKIFSIMSQMNSKMTATQIQAMQGEQATLLQPIVTRDQNENLIPLIRKTFKVLAKVGRLPPPPPSIMQFANTPVDITFSGPVAMLAKRYLQMQGFNATVPEILELAAKYPALQPMMDRLDPDAVYDYIMDAGGAPTKVTRDEKIVMQIRKQREDQMKAQQKLDAMDKANGALQKGSKAPEQGSPAANLMGAQQ